MAEVIHGAVQQLPLIFTKSPGIFFFASNKLILVAAILGLAANMGNSRAGINSYTYGCLQFSWSTHGRPPYIIGPALGQPKK